MVRPLSARRTSCRAGHPRFAGQLKAVKVNIDNAPQLARTLLIQAVDSQRTRVVAANPLDLMTDPRLVPLADDAVKRLRAAIDRVSAHTIRGELQSRLVL